MAIVAAVLLLPVVYVLSSGSLARLLPFPLWETVYSPLLWLCGVWEPLAYVLLWYLDLWGAQPF